MSFLLRNRSSNSSGRVIPSSHIPRAHPAPRPRSTSTHNDEATKGSSIHGTRSGNQVLLQRTGKPPQFQSQPQVQKVSKHGQNQQNQEIGAQNVISMSEVLADLRVLEQQQRDAQRQLMSARSTKEQRVEQQAALESKLEHLKYSNGEFRAQILQSREVLSTSTRALGSRRLLTDKAGGEIRDFEKKLNRGLQSARLNTVCRRKIESLFILMETKLDVLARVKVEAKDKLNTLETTLKAARDREETLRASIQQEAARRQRLASEIASVRAQTSEAENELLAAQNMEESTRTRAQAITSQVNDEKRSMEEHRNELSNQITHVQEKLSSIEQQSVLLDENLAGVLQELTQTKAMLVIPQEHLTELGRCDNEKVKTIVETNRATICDLQNSNGSTQHEIEKLIGEIDANVNLSSSNRSKSHDLTKAAEEMLIRETSRSDELKMYQSEIEKERTIVENLETSAANLHEIRSLTCAKHKQTLIEYDVELEQLQLSINVVRQGIEQNLRASETKKNDWEIERGQLLTALETTKEATTAAEAKLNELDSISRELETSSQEKLRQEIMCVQAQKTKYTQDFDAKVASILKRRPQLGPVVVDFVYDATIAKREHIIQALGEIKANLEGRIREAKRSTSQRKQMRKERKREAESVANLVQQHDETRRKNRERKAAKHKLQKGERREDIDNDSDTWQTLDAARESRQKESITTSLSKSVKGAEFFCPQSHDVLSEDESPAQPKSLLSAFSNARAGNSKPSINAALSMDKRVHWKDDGCEDLAVEKILLRSEELMPTSTIEQMPTLDSVGRSHNHIDDSDDEGTMHDYKDSDQVSKPIVASDGPPVMTSQDSSESDVDSIIFEESDPTRFRRKGRQYGTTKRGLAAIARSRKGSTMAQIHTDTGARVLSSRGSTSKYPNRDPQEISSNTKEKHDSKVSFYVGHRTQHKDYKKTGEEPKLKTTMTSDVTKHPDRDVRAPTDPARTTLGKNKDHFSGKTDKTNDRKSLTGPFRQHSKFDPNEVSVSAGARDLISVVEKKRRLVRNDDSGSVRSRRAEPVIPSSRKTIDGRTPASASSQAFPGPTTDNTRSKSLCNSNPKSTEAESCRRSVSSKKMIDLTSKKRKLQEKSVFTTQSSGLSSSENTSKSRRRKKSWPTQRASISMADDSYAFAF